MARKSNVEIIKEQKNTIKQLFGAYTILLCAAAIFIFSLHNLFINYRGAKLCMMYLLAPIIFFISNVTNKEIGYKNAMMSVGISTFVLFFYGLCTNFIIYNSFNLFSCLGFTIAYLFSQSVSLAIYNYLLVNTRLPIAGVIINYIFDLLIYNMICKATRSIKVSVATIKTTNQGKIMKTLLMLIKWTILYVIFGIITIPVMIIRELKK